MAASNLPSAARGTVAVAWANPDSVLADYARVMHLAHSDAHLSRAADTAVAPEVRWHAYSPGASSPPWQLDSVCRTLADDGYARDRTFVCAHGAGWVDVAAGARAHKLAAVAEQRHGLATTQLWADAWTRVRPSARLMALHDAMPAGIDIPVRLRGCNLLHLPTLKVDRRTVLAGAMAHTAAVWLRRPPAVPRAAVGDLLADCVTLQQEYAAGVFTVMDGTVAGNGGGAPGLLPHVKNVVLASGDPVALDAVAAKLMGLDPWTVPGIRAAHERGLGVGRFEEITVVGDDVTGVNFHFAAPARSLAHRILGDAAGDAVEAALTPVLGPYLDALVYAYYRWLWYPIIGTQRVSEMADTGWERLFREYA